MPVLELGLSEADLRGQRRLPGGGDIYLDSGEGLELSWWGGEVFSPWEARHLGGGLAEISRRGFVCGSLIPAVPLLEAVRSVERRNPARAVTKQTYEDATVLPGPSPGMALAYTSGFTECPLPCSVTRCC